MLLCQNLESKLDILNNFIYPSMYDKTDPRIITIVFSGLMLRQYGIKPAAVFSPVDPCYGGVLEQYHILQFNSIVFITPTQWYL